MHFTRIVFSQLIIKHDNGIENIELNKDHETMIKAHEETKPFFK